MPEHANGRQRAVLPIADRNHVGVTTYAAKSPATNSGRSSRSGRRPMLFSEDADHLVTPDARLKIAMVRQSD